MNILAFFKALMSLVFGWGAEGRPPFSLGYVVQCSDLGGAIGRIQLVGADDTERPFAVPGLLGGLVKEQVCRMTLTWLRQERGRAGRYTWRNQPPSPAPTRGSVLGSA